MARDSIEQRFVNFHAAHPDVYDQLLDLCRQYRRRRSDRWSIDAAFHVMRWYRMLDAKIEEGGYHMNNDFTALYARKLMAENADVDGMFELRVRRERVA